MTFCGFLWYIILMDDEKINASGSKLSRLKTAKLRLAQKFPKYALILAAVTIIDGSGSFSKGTVYGCTDCRETIWVETDMHNDENSIMKTLAHEVKHIQKNGGCCNQIEHEIAQEGIGNA